MVDIEDIRKEHSVEVALIILTCRVYFKTAGEPLIEEFVKKHPINWDHFFLSCVLHSVRPIVYPTIVNNAGLPPEIRRLMEADISSLTIRNWYHARETERIILLMKTNNIRVLPYKGVAFSKQFFGDLTSRESSDIDLAIDKADIDAVIRIMERDGYLTQNSFIYDYLGRRYLKEYKDINFNKYKDTVRLFHVEFHWDVAERFLTLDKQVNDLLSKQGNNITIFRNASPCLNADAHFVTLIINHVWRDVLKDIKALIDIGICIQDRSELLNWDDIHMHIEHLRLKRGFRIAVLLADQLFGISNRNCVSAGLPEKAEDRFVRRLLRRFPTGKGPVISKAYFSSQLLLRENLSDKLKFSLAFFRYIFYPKITDFQMIRLPGYLFFIYPVIRPVRALFKRLIFRKKKGQITDGLTGNIIHRI